MSIRVREADRMFSLRLASSTLERAIECVMTAECLLVLQGPQSVVVGGTRGEEGTVDPCFILKSSVVGLIEVYNLVQSLLIERYREVPLIYPHPSAPSEGREVPPDPA